MGLKKAGTRATVDAVTALSARDVWAVGQIWYRSSRPKTGSSWGPAMPLVVHWDGSMWRTIVDSVSSH